MIDQFWWNKDEDKAHESIFAAVNFHRRNQIFRQELNLRHMRLYGNMDTLGVNIGTYYKDKSPKAEDRLKLNVVQSCVDTVVAQCTQDDPRVMFLTDGGNFELKQRAKKLNKFVEAMFYVAESYDYTERAAFDAGAFGSGITKVYAHNGKSCEDRVFPNEIIVDDVQSFYGKPRDLYQVKAISREVLKAMYPKFEQKIDSAKKADETVLRNDFAEDQVMVVEGWHLKSGEDTEDGKHAIAIDNATLFFEDYDYDDFPFAKLDWTRRLAGWWGQGIAEQLTGLQLEINKLLRTIQMAMHLCSVPHWLVQQGSKVVQTQLNNMIGGLIYFSGTPPTLQVTNAVPPELREHLRELVNRAYETVGISQLTAQGKKPAGLDSGRALREFIDIQNNRFGTFQKRIEAYQIQKAKLHIQVTKKIAEDGGDIAVRYRGKRGLELIKWSEVNMDEDQYQIKAYPTSFLPKTPAGRFQTIQEYVQAGFIPQEEAIKLLDFPDLESSTNLLTAASEDIDLVIAKIIEENEYTTPEPYQNLEMGLTKMQSAYLRAKIDLVPEERLDKMRQWMEQAAALLNPPPIEQAETPPIGAETMIQPQAVPEPPPQSDLLANAPMSTPQ